MSADRLILKSSVRWARRHPWQVVLAVVGVAAGVTVISGLDLAIAEARRDLQRSARVLSGTATHQLIAGGAPLPPGLVDRLRAQPGVRVAAPVAERRAWLTEPGAASSGAASTDGAEVRLLGLDPASESGLGSAGGPSVRGRGGNEAAGSRVSLRGLELHLDLAAPWASLARGMSPDELAGTLAAAAAVPSGPAGTTRLELPDGSGALPLVLDVSTAQRLDVGPGSRLDVDVGGRVRPATVLAVATPLDSTWRSTLDGLAIAPLSAVLEAVGASGPDRIDLLLDRSLHDSDAPHRRLLDVVREIAPGAALLDARERADAALGLRSAFELNLRALSWLGMACGLLLVFSTVSFSIVERRPLLGLLRAQGVGRRRLLVLVLLEVGLVASLGSAIGVGLGRLLSFQLLGRIQQTTEDLYSTGLTGLSDGAFTGSTWSWIWSGPSVGRSLSLFVLGVVASCAAALPAALRAARSSPRAILDRREPERRFARWSGRRRALGGLLGGIAIGLLALPDAPVLDRVTERFTVETTLAGILAGLLAWALFSPDLTSAILTLLRRLALRADASTHPEVPSAELRGTTGERLDTPSSRLARLAVAGAERSKARTAVALAALSLAVATGIGIGLMVASFRAALETWLDTTLSDDVYLSSLVGEETLSPAQLARLAAIDGVERVSTVRRLVVERSAEQGPAGDRSERIRLRVLDIDRAGLDSLELLRGGTAAGEVDPDLVYERLLGGAVLVSEPWLRRRAPGSSAPAGRLELPTPSGPHRLEVAGVYRDFSTDQGEVTLLRPAFETLWRNTVGGNVPGPQGASLRLEPGGDPKAAARAAGQALGERWLARTSNDLSAAAVTVFRRTFAITDVLRYLVAGVAFLAVLGSLAALQLERRRELAVLRALGLSRRRLRRLIRAENLLLGGIAVLLSLPLGVALAAALVDLVQVRSFGWSFPLRWSARPLVEGVLLSMVAAWAAGALPARRLARVGPAEALREE